MINAKPKGPLSESNYQSHYLRFQKRQAGVSLVYSPEDQRYYYNVYCIDAQIHKELYTVEHSFLSDALELINEEFATWELQSFEGKKNGCSSCVAK